jgi:hypothetical protein
MTDTTTPPASDDLIDNIEEWMDGLPEGPWVPVMHEVDDRAMVVTGSDNPMIIARFDGAPDEGFFDIATQAALRIYCAIMSPQTTRALLARIAAEKARADAAEAHINTMRERLIDER